MTGGTHWLGARRRAWAALACVALFAVLAHQHRGAGPLVALDLQVMAWLAGQRNAELTAGMLALTLLHNNPPLLAATATLALWLAWRRHWRSVLVLGVVPTAMLLNAGLKELFGRVRPVLDEPVLLLTTLSFPSGHATASTAFWGAACALVWLHHRGALGRAAAVLVAAVLVALVCFSRLYLGVHFLTDVVAGASWTLALLFGWLLLAGRLVQQASGRPSRASGAASPKRDS